ncbi:exodeoxyribonuclease III [Candidatus Woesearchaeota archaeon]|jgi:exodeoxyribonuclease III|nr:exodeoxyribonuclease III [Candidatus Woesearchaeota archaeon]MBT5740011.1 exodeoxyribonuclease III [Candidatus Woesearchaeota archaeon]
MNIISWNVNGIRAILKKDFKEQIKSINPDILCLQETKAHPDQVDEMLKKYEHHFWNASIRKKGYSGTAIFSKIQPISITYGINEEEHDQEGRVITAEFKDFYLITVYTPNSGRGLVRLDYRQTWDKSFLKFVKKLEKTKPVIICGDLNVAHTEIDLANPVTNYNKTAGYTQQEIDGFENLIKADFIDTFRMFNKEPKHYTYWGYWNNLRKRNIGWRIDYFLVSKTFKNQVKDSKILSEMMGSDHCPVELVLK